MKVAVAVLGILAEVVGWHLVVRGGRSVWTVMTAVFAATGIATALVADVAVSPAVGSSLAIAVGLAAGLVLFAATRAFVALVRPWDAFRRQASSMYGRRERIPLWWAVALTVLVMVPGEELFWRGLVQASLAGEVGWLASAPLTWLAYVAANLPSRNLSILAGALVGGALWAGLAVWTEGVAASLVCHATWTALMLAFPAVLPSEPAEVP